MMKRLILLVIMLVITSGCQKEETYETSTMMVTIDDEGNLQAIEEAVEGAFFEPVGDGRYILSSDQVSAEKLLEHIEAIEGVVDYIIPKEVSLVEPIEKIRVGLDYAIDGIDAEEDLYYNDPGLAYQWSLGYTSTMDTWEVMEQDYVATVAVIDTGIDYTHKDLLGRVDTSRGYDFVNNDEDAMDDNGHGTHVAGIIGASANNGLGISGVVGEFDIVLVPIKVMDQNGSGTVDDILRGIRYATDIGVDIINLSVGLHGVDEDIEAAIDYAVNAGVLVVVAAGNETVNCDESAIAGHDDAYTVSATNMLNRKAVFSNYGDSVDIGAPGTKILSTVPGDAYEAWDGTSMAAPIVTGVAALLKSVDGSLSADDIIEIMNHTADDLLRAVGRDKRTGNGLINTYEALLVITED